MTELLRRRSVRPWTKLEDSILNELAGSSSTRKIAKKLERTPRAIQHRIEFTRLVLGIMMGVILLLNSLVSREFQPQHCVSNCG